VDVTTPPTDHTVPGEDDVLAFLAGFADADTEHRVLVAALTDPALRSRLAANGALLAAGDAAESAPLSSEEAIALAARAAALRRRPPTPIGPRVTTIPLADRLRSAGRRILDFVGGPVTLPGLAPALAAPPVDSVALHRQAFDSPDGARVELHQLPGDPPRLRAIVDTGRPAASGAFVTLHFSDGEGGAQAALPVALNEQGRGLAEAMLGPGSDGLLLPAREGWQLVGVELSESGAGGD